MNSGNFVDLTFSDDEIDIEILPLPSKKSVVMAPAPSSSSSSSGISTSGMEMPVVGTGSNLESYVNSMDVMANYDEEYKRHLAIIQQEADDQKLSRDMMMKERRLYEIQRQREKAEEQQRALNAHHHGNNLNNGNGNGERRVLPNSVVQPFVPPPVPVYAPYTPTATVSCTLISLNEFTIR